MKPLALLLCLMIFPMISSAASRKQTGAGPGGPESGAEAGFEAGAKAKVIGDLTFCHFGPKTKVLAVVFEPHPGLAGKDDKCTGTAKIQVVGWKCGNPDRLEGDRAQIRRMITEAARAECTKHCENRARHCRGLFTAPFGCGLETDREDAIAMGKREGCRSDCEGQAFAYCSIYDAGFRTDDPERLAKHAPNCRCAIETK